MRFIYTAMLNRCGEGNRKAHQHIHGSSIPSSVCVCVCVGVGVGVCV